MKTAGHFGLLLSLLVVTVVQSHTGSNDNNNNDNNNNDNNPWSNYAGFDKTKWNSLSYYLKKLPQKQFFGMKFILNVTGESCKPRWNIPKPSCWHGGWPWPWPGHGGGSGTTPRGIPTTTRRGGVPTTKYVPTTTRKYNPTSVKMTTKYVITTTWNAKPTTTKYVPPTTTKTVLTTKYNPTTGKTSVAPSQPPTTQTTTTTTTTTTRPPTTQAATQTTQSGTLETTTCPYAIDIMDQNWCRDIRDAAWFTGPMKDCMKYFSNDTMFELYAECIQFQCKYQRAYRCYGTWKFASMCFEKLAENETIRGWRRDNVCPENSTPFPAITFTDIPTTQAAVVGKRSAGFNEESTDEEDSEAIEEGTDSVAFGIKNNWCVPQIYSWWWIRNGHSLPGHSSEGDDSDWSNGWSGENSGDDNSHDNSGHWGDDSSNDSGDDDNNNNGGGHGGTPVKPTPAKPKPNPVKPHKPVKTPVKKARKPAKGRGRRVQVKKTNNKKTNKHG